MGHRHPTGPETAVWVLVSRSFRSPRIELRCLVRAQRCLAELVPWFPRRRARWPRGREQTQQVSTLLHTTRRLGDHSRRGIGAVLETGLVAGERAVFVGRLWSCRGQVKRRPNGPAALGKAFPTPVTPRHEIRAPPCRCFVDRLAERSAWQPRGRPCGSWDSDTSAFLSVGSFRGSESGLFRVTLFLRRSAASSATACDQIPTSSAPLSVRPWGSGSTSSQKSGWSSSLASLALWPYRSKSSMYLFKLRSYSRLA